MADFAHRFTETQNELEKLLPNIRRAPASDGNADIELITAFTIKLKDHIVKELFSRDVKHMSLQAVISAAERFQMHLPSLASTQPAQGHEDLSNWEPVAHYSGTLPRRPTRPQSKDTGRSSRDHYDPKLNSSGISDSSSSFRPRARPHNFSVQGNSPQKSKEICLMFNKFKSSTCELPNNQCANHCLHKCSFCHKWGCKAYNHRANGPGHFNKSKSQKYQGHVHVASNPSLSGQGSGNGDQSRSSSSPSEPTSNAELTTVLSNMQQSLQNLSFRMEKLEQPPNPIASVASHIPPGAVSGTDILKQAPAYSCPAVTAIPSHLSISDLDLANKHILWAPITSAGVALPLPLDSCCSLSLVSKAHAEIIAQKHPQLTFTKLQSPLPVAVANPSSQLTAIGVMQVPIIWENGRPSIFSMLVVPGFAWPILFGQNQLCKTQAHTNHAALQVYFADPQLNFTVKCHDANPFDAFPSLRNQPSSSASQDSPSTHVTCLLTAMPTPSHHSSHIRLHRGYNLVTLCLVMTASLVGSTMFSSPHWLEDNEISPGVQVVSGPVNLNSI